MAEKISVKENWRFDSTFPGTCSNLLSAYGPNYEWKFVERNGVRQFFIDSLLRRRLLYEKIH